MQNPHRRIHPWLLSVAATVGVFSMEALAQSEAAPAAHSTEPNRHVVASGPLTLNVEREGRIESADKTRVRLIPEEYKGSFEVAEVVRRTGRVKKGDVLLRLNGEALELELIAAQMAADHARRRLQLAVDEQRILAEANAMKLQLVQKSRENAEKELMIWEKYDSPGMLKNAELSLRQREFGLADQKQELEQLESMYSGTHLATETKDIVLDRARRGVMMSEAWLALSINSELVTREYRHAIQDRNVRDALRQAVQEEAHTKVNLGAAEQRKSMELETARQSLVDAERRLGRLQKDKDLLTVVAPADGIITRIELEPRDAVQPRQAICEVLNPAKMRVKFSLTAEDLRAIDVKGSSTGAPAAFTLHLPEYPEIRVTGTLDELSEIGAPADNATHFPLSITLNATDPAIRLGMRCKVFATHTFSDVLTIPKAAVTWEDAGAWCLVQTADGEQKRQITVGASNREHIVVADGIAIGDVIVVPEASGK